MSNYLLLAITSIGIYSNPWWGEHGRFINHKNILVAGASRPTVKGWVAHIYVCLSGAFSARNLAWTLGLIGVSIGNVCKFSCNMKRLSLFSISDEVTDDVCKQQWMKYGSNILLYTHAKYVSELDIMEEYPKVGIYEWPCIISVITLWYMK